MAALVLAEQSELWFSTLLWEAAGYVWLLCAICLLALLYKIKR